jgi:hypothetical protein
MPGYLFVGLSNFDWVTWIEPNNVVINQLFGYSHGLGMSVLTLDWAQIAFLGSPLATPCESTIDDKFYSPDRILINQSAIGWAEVNVAAGFLFFFWFLTPILYYTNTWYSLFLPFVVSFRARSINNILNGIFRQDIRTWLL